MQNHLRFNDTDQIFHFIHLNLYLNASRYSLTQWFIDGQRLNTHPFPKIREYAAFNMRVDSKDTGYCFAFVQINKTPLIEAFTNFPTYPLPDYTVALRDIDKPPSETPIGTYDYLLKYKKKHGSFYIKRQNLKQVLDNLQISVNNHYVKRNQDIYNTGKKP